MKAFFEEQIYGQLTQVPAIGIHKNTTIAVVGAGGKTNTVFTAAKELGEKGLHVAVTTTTHMMFPDEHSIRIGENEPLPSSLPFEEHPYLFISDREVKAPGYFKATALSDSVFEALQEQADVVLVEADGAKRLPYKVPAAHEPVIPRGTRQIWVLMGLSSIGKKISETVCRTERFCELVDCKEADILDPERAAMGLVKGFVLPLQGSYPDAGILCILNQADTEEDRITGRKIACILKREAGDDLPVILTCRGKEERV